jgi:hypothetical protein
MNMANLIPSVLTDEFLFPHCYQSGVTTSGPHVQNSQSSSQEEFFLNCFALENMTDGLSRNVRDYQSTLRSFSEKLRFQLVIL